MHVSGTGSGNDSGRVAVIGLDGAVPDLAFERYADRMPTLSRLREEGAWGRLRSIDPPITVPAWSCAMTGLSPGALGIYGFRNRRDHTYDRLVFSTSRAVTAPRVWERLSDVGRPSIVVGVPGTYPPKPIEGALVGCFLTPSTNSDYTWPPELKAEIEAEVGPYILDVEDFRSEEKERVLAHVHEMTRTRFRLARHLVATRPWEFFMLVEIGGDRLQHAFWAYAHPDHRNYRPDPVLGPALGDYYAVLDAELAELLAVLGPDVDVFVISDHGAQHMAGGFCINEWLRQQGYLRLEEEPVGPTPMPGAKVDWERTVAWADGGYFGELRWRPVATMGLGLYTFENDTGPDDANHAMDGIFVAAGPRVPLRGEQYGTELMQIGPTILGLYGLEQNCGA